MTHQEKLKQVIDDTKRAVEESEDDDTVRVTAGDLRVLVAAAEFQLKAWSRVSPEKAVAAALRPIDIRDEDGFKASNYAMDEED